MFKKISITLASLAVVFFVLLPAVGLPVSYILSAPGVATGIGVKLACSSKYISGYDETQTFDDIVEYSPILQYIDLQYDDHQKRVTATIFGINRTTASYRPGLECAIEYPGYTARNDIQPPEYLQSDLPWPAGVAETVNIEHIKRHYFESHRHINPYGIVPDGPELDFNEPQDRARLASRGDNSPAMITGSVN